jgi:hypothetical protein
MELDTSLDVIYLIFKNIKERKEIIREGIGGDVYSSFESYFHKHVLSV